MSARLKLFRQFCDWVMPQVRSQRMALFDQRMHIEPGMRVLDLGGTSYNWQWVRTPLDVTVLNLPGGVIDTKVDAPHTFHFVEGDATQMPQYADRSFDLVFSNSVIEHVGGLAKQESFAREARRLGRGYYIQTPSKYFPLEAHTGLPFWWYYPSFLKKRLIRKWETTLPLWCDMVKGTTVISAASMQRFFPDGTLWTERFAGLPKSYTIYKPLAR